MGSQAEKRGVNAATRGVMPGAFEGIKIEMGFRADLVFEDKVFFEIPSVAEFADMHRKQLLTNLRLAGLRRGPPFNFNVALNKTGMVRNANGMGQ